MTFTIAVTGASGLLGTALCKLVLENGHVVVGIDVVSSPLTHENFIYKAVDTTNYEQFLAAVKGCNALVHLAVMPRAEDTPQHRRHNVNVTSSYNALQIAAELRIEKVVMASSVNVIGLVSSRRPKFDYLPLDEQHPWYPEDAYSLSKCILEKQADAFARRYSWMRIASLRFHWIISSRERGTKALADAGLDSDVFAEHTRDLWGWVSLSAAARACLLGITAPETAFRGHEAFFIVAPTTLVSKDSAVLHKEVYPEVKDIRRAFSGNSSFFDCSKAHKLLGWYEEGK